MTTYVNVKMKYLSLLFNQITDVYLFMLVVICLSSISPTYSLEKDSENVCSRLTSVRVVDVYPSNWSDFWDCQLYYPAKTCDLIRSGDINIEVVYFVREELYCCPGWMTSTDDDDDNDDDDDEKECDQRCPSGYFGENCQYQCRCFNSPTPESCEPTDGACDCSPGWTGRECDQSCSPGRYGPNCSLRTEVTCQNGGTNYPESGFGCLCARSFTGFDCGIPIQPGEADPISCESCGNGICDHINQVCICEKDFGGRYCTDLCNVGKGGQFCRSDCCSGNGRCYRDECFCQDGYNGTECETKCKDGKYGRDCQLDCPCRSCHHVTGVCTSCPPGLKGDTCTEPCSPSEWGEFCNNTCTCESGQVCDVFTGQCLAPDGADSSSTIVAVVAVLVVGILLITCIVVCGLFLRKRSQREVQNKNTQLDAVENQSYSTLTARNEASQYADLTLDNRYGPSIEFTENEAYSHEGKGPPSKADNKVSNPLYGVQAKEVIPSKEDGHHYNTIDERKEQPEYDGDHYLVPKQPVTALPVNTLDYAVIKKY